VRAVLGQQVSVKAGRTLAARLVARFGTPVEDAADGLTHLFPGPAALATADLDGLGLTKARAHALVALGRAAADGRLDFGAPVDDVTAALEALPGLGPWTAQYVALRALGEPDAFPAGDLVLRRMAASNGVPLTPRALLARAEAWRPWRGYAVLHLWQAAAEALEPSDHVRKRPVRAPRRE
jgi:AraC family transcriptional regulator of adaptative response / DNA-3-methyladenine glycosylase II